MAVNLSSRQFSLTIASVDHTNNLLSIQLKQNELQAESGEISITGTITLIAPYGHEHLFGYLNNPSGWYRGAPISYMVANSSGTLSTHPLAGGLCILKEPNNPKLTDNTITIEVGCQLSLLNYRTADKDHSDVIPRQSTPRADVVSRYLTAADVAHSLTSIPYPFAYPQPMTGGTSLIDVAGKMCRSANHFLFTQRNGTVTNRAINTNPAIATTFQVGKDDAHFDQTDSGAVETPVDVLTIVGMVTAANADEYPKTVLNTFMGRTTTEIVNTTRVTSTPIRIERTTENWIEDTYSNTKEAFFPESDPKTFSTGLPQQSLVIKNKTYSKIADNSSAKALTKEVEREFLKNKLIRTIDISYTYNQDQTLSGKVTDIRMYYKNLPIQSGDNVYFQTGNERKDSQSLTIESWANKVYSITQYAVIPKEEEKGLQFIETRNFENTLPPSTEYKQPYLVKETLLKVEIKVAPQVGNQYKARSRPIEVPFAVNEQQLQEYGELYGKLLYARKFAFECVGAYTDAMTTIEPLQGIDVIWNGVVYRGLIDGLSWVHTGNEMAMAFKVLPMAKIPIGETEPTPIAVTGPLITPIIEQYADFQATLSTGKYIGGIISQDSLITATLSSSLHLSVTIEQSQTITATIS